MVTTFVFTVDSVHVELRTEKKNNKIYLKSYRRQFFSLWE
jgi:hypothetical protein